MSPAESNAIAQAINRRNVRTTHRAEAAAGFVVALVVAILGALALVHFATPCEGATLCMALAARSINTGEGQQPQHPDERLAVALKAAWQAGHDEAERTQYMAGWRSGLIDGLVIGCVAGAMLVFGALHFGLITGAL